MYDVPSMKTETRASRSPLSSRTRTRSRSAHRRHHDECSKTSNRTHATQSMSSMSSLTLDLDFHRRRARSVVRERSNEPAENYTKATERRRRTRSLTTERMGKMQGSREQESNSKKPTKEKANRKSKRHQIKRLENENEELTRKNRRLEDDMADLNWRLIAMEKALYLSALDAKKKEVKENKTSGVEKNHMSPSPSEKAVSSSKTSVHKQRRAEAEDKMLRAMQAMKFVTSKQDKNIHELKSSLRKNEEKVSDREQYIMDLEAERDMLKQKCRTYEKDCSTNEIELSELQSELTKSLDMTEDLEEKYGQATAQNSEVTILLQESEANGRRVQEELEITQKTLRNKNYDLAKLEAQLSEKMERTRMLENQLEQAAKELQQLKDKKIMNETFPEMGATVDDFSEDPTMWGASGKLSWV